MFTSSIPHHNIKFANNFPYLESSYLLSLILLKNSAVCVVSWNDDWLTKLKYSKLPVIQNKWGLGWVGYMNLLVLWGLRKSYFQAIFSKSQYFHFLYQSQNTISLLFVSRSFLIDTADWWVKDSRYTIRQSQISLASTVIIQQYNYNDTCNEGGQWAGLPVVAGRHGEWVHTLFMKQLYKNSTLT
jgi:hypothetical protein